MSGLSQGLLKIIILKHMQVQQLSVYQELLLISHTKRETTTSLTKECHFHPKFLKWWGIKTYKSLQPES